jgi:catechol 2,3-dioxygenase-like lactoylglutathione lyase family enzyme
VRVEGIVWMGVRTAAFPGLRELFADVMGMEITRSSDGVTWFGLPGGEEIQIYAEDDVDHAFFPSGPVVGFRVADFAAAHAELDGAGVEWIGAGDHDASMRWRHFRAPDGNVYEILGPVTDDQPSA